MTGLTVRQMANNAELAFTTLVRLESAGNEIPGGNIETLKKLKKAFEDMGIEFLGTPDEGAGVCWKRNFPKK
jgi:hypothetical protein